MNKLSAVVTIAVGVIALSFSNIAEGTAVVDKRSGVDVYVLSRPSNNYEVINSGKVVVLMDCNEIINKAVKKAVNDQADGVR